MRFFLPLLLSAIGISVNADSVSNYNTLQCIEGTVDYDNDYFPHKVTPKFSAHWDITYHKTYKILTNTQTEPHTSWLLYQCGTEPPTGEIGKHQGSFEVPLQDGVVLSTSTHLTHMEQLGIRRQLKGMIGSVQWINSPCFKTLRDEGLIEGIPADEIDTWLLDHPKAAIIQTAGDHPNTIHFSGRYEAESRDIYEWHKVFGALFNLEEKANEQFDDSSQRFDCAADNADYLMSKRRRSRGLELKNVMETKSATRNSHTGGNRKLKEKPKVLWGSYTAYNNPPAWDTVRCDLQNNYYCEFANKCSAELLHSNDGSIDADYATDGSKHMTLEEFVEFGKDADYWIYPGFNWDNTWKEFNETLKQFKSVQNGEVYDVQKTSGTWFEHRIAEYDIVLQDFCEIVGANDDGKIPHTRMYLRKLLPEPEKMESLDACPANIVDMPWQSRASDCIFLRPDGSGKNEKKPTSGAAGKATTMGAIVAAILISLI